MGVRYKTKKDITDKVLKNVKPLNGASVSVGVFEGEHQW